MTSRPTVLASLVLALALLGDSLLYAVLPLHASTFGVSLAWVGVLLSANRVVRLFLYPVLARIAATGLRRFTMAAATLGALSTLGFAFGSGAWALLASRIAWGTAFGSLSLSALAYATASRHDAGKRVGLSLSLRELGPLSSLTAGTIAVSALGVRPALGLLGVVSLLGVAIATLLPDARIHLASRRRSPRPTGHEWLSAVAGFVLDGVFPATIGLLLARSADVSGAVLGAGMLLAFKRIAMVVLAPISGHAADRFGGGVATIAGFTVAATGAFFIACDSTIAGAVLLCCGAAVTSTTIPVSAARHAGLERVQALARLGIARDAGAAAGPLVALAVFDVAGAVGVYAAAGALLVAIPVRRGTTTEPQRAQSGTESEDTAADAVLQKRDVEVEE